MQPEILTYYKKLRIAAIFVNDVDLELISKRQLLFQFLRN